MKVKIIAPPKSNPGAKPEVIGEIDGDDIVHGDGAGTVTGASIRKLIQILGDAYGNRAFHMEIGDVLLTNCRVVRVGADITFQYMASQPAPRK
jgi:hypothetical protein